MARKKQKKSYPKRDIYQEVTDRILEFLDKGVVPWHNPIRRGSGDGWPKNLSSGKPYRGINVFLLALSGYGSDFWMTFKQAAASGGQVRKGETGSLVTFWKLYDTKDKYSGEDITVPVLKHYTAFNLEQIDGIEIPDAPKDDPDAIPFEPLVQAESIVGGYKDKPVIEHNGSKSRYRPSHDTVIMPHPERFESREQYYCTLFHELSHSTGYSKRLNRGLDEKLQPFGSPDYSKEELVAEMSAAFLNAVAGISPPTIEQSAAYINGWIKILKSDKRLVVAAAGAAQKSADLILGEAFHETSTKTPSSKPAVETKPVSMPKEERLTDKPAQLDLF